MYCSCMAHSSLIDSKIYDLKKKTESLKELIKKEKIDLKKHSF